MDKKKVRNTTQGVKDNPLGFLMGAMGQGTSEMIENQEADGQSSFVSSTTLPTKIMTDKGRKILNKAGVQFGDNVEGDEMFQYVELPEGWEKKPTDHSMWSKLVDDKGRERASIFYKAAFYDRSAHMSLSRRYNYHQDYDRCDKGEFVAIITDCGEPIHETEPLILTEGQKGYELSDDVRKLAGEWLDTHYPKWQNPAAYWD